MKVSEVAATFNSAIEYIKAIIGDDADIGTVIADGSCISIYISDWAEFVSLLTTDATMSVKVLKDIKYLYITAVMAGLKLRYCVSVEQASVEQLTFEQEWNEAVGHERYGLIHKNRKGV